MLDTTLINLTDGPEFQALKAEIILVLLALTFQTLAAFYPKSSRLIGVMTIYCGVAALVYFLLRIYYFQFSQMSGILSSFNGTFIEDLNLLKIKAFTWGLALMSLIFYQSLTKIAAIEFKMEFYTLIILSTVGIFITISARDFILLFCGLELQALAGYALAAFKPEAAKSAEAGLKYFILGALISCLMLFGLSFLYGFSGSLNYDMVYSALNNGPVNIGLVIGSILVLTAILFKLSVAPLHIWTPDVYEGAPIAAVSYFSVAQKIGMLVVLTNILELVIGNFVAISVDIIRVASILSMIIGAFGALMQSSLKRLMAYSTVLNVGYVLIGITLHSPAGIRAAFIYMIVYIIAVMGFFVCLGALLGEKADNATFDDLGGIAATRKTPAASIAILMFSMIGLPPLAGFVGKYYVFLNAIEHGEFTLAICGVTTSVIAAFYYLKAVKYMYFDEALNSLKLIPINKGLPVISSISVIFTLFFLVFASDYVLGPGLQG